MGEHRRPPGDNVIHVAFGARRRLHDARRGPPAPGAPPVAPALEPIRPNDPVAAVYTRDEVARLFGLNVPRLKAWERSGIARPTAYAEGRKLYTFQDLLGVRTARELLDRGVPLVRIKRALDALRASLPRNARLSELRISSDGATVVVRDRGATLDPTTGQLLFDFNVAQVRDEVVRSLPARPAQREARTAYEFYLEGCRLDADEAARPRAEAAYRRAIELDPTLAGAYTNLGILRLGEGALAEAEALFGRAMMVDATQAEAPYNLGFLRLRAGAHEEAIDLLRRAVGLDPEFADAHFNLAIALEEVGRAPQALPHWGAYLALCPEGPYAAAARQRVRDE